VNSGSVRSAGSVVDDGHVGGGGSIVLSSAAEHTLLLSVDANGHRGVAGTSGGGLHSLGVCGNTRGRGVLAGRELEVGEVLLGEEEEVDENEDWLGENIEDTVPDHLGVGGDVVSSIGETPSDGVEKPEKREDRGRDGEGSLETATEHSGGTSGRAEEYPPDVEFCCTTKGKVSPLVRCRHEGAYKASDDHDKVHEDCRQDVREGKSRGHQEGKEQSGGGNNPVDVSDIPDRSGGAKRETVCVRELNLDRGATKSRSHGEVGDGSGGEDDDRKLVEDSVSPRDGKVPGHDSQIGKEHHCKDCPKPVTSPHSDILGRGIETVDIDCVVGHCVDECNGYRV